MRSSRRWRTCIGRPGRCRPRFGAPEIKYRARDRALLYSEDVTPLWTPAPERFREELDLLFQLAELNAKVNHAAAR